MLNTVQKIFASAFTFGPPPNSLELYLKGLVWDGMELGILEKDDKIRDLLGSHNLHTLWHKGRFVLEEVWPSFPFCL